jgi:predicted ABC-type ATPase
MIARTLQSISPATFPIAAARQVLASAGEHVRKCESFAVETTLAGKHYLRLMLSARKRNFEIVLVYIGTENVEINVTRIRNRVLAGGHDVPEQDVRRRYMRSFETSQPPSTVRTIPSCSITQPTKATVWSRSSARREISGSSPCPGGQQQIVAPEKCALFQSGEPLPFSLSAKEWGSPKSTRARLPKVRSPYYYPTPPRHCEPRLCPSRSRRYRA